jgi:1,2-phenylacetyl-CoA epoxidase PaaB subunit
MIWLFKILKGKINNNIGKWKEKNHLFRKMRVGMYLYLARLRNIKTVLIDEIGVMEINELTTNSTKEHLIFQPTIE